MHAKLGASADASSETRHPSLALIDSRQVYALSKGVDQQPLCAVESGYGTTFMSPITQLPTPDRTVADSKDADLVKVLCVDDLAANLASLEATLDGLGLELVRATSGPEALKCLLKEQFALILLDVKMPGMDGFETAEVIRKRKRCQHTPIIFLTASERDELQVFKGYALGAVDYLCKPLIPEILRSKVLVFVDIHRKTELVRSQGEQLRRLEHEHHQRELAAAQHRFEAQRLRQEICLARQIQQKLFPPPRQQSCGFDISGASIPAEATGGDYFDYVSIQGGLGVVVGDVSGHGFGPALLMVALRAYLRAFLRTRSDVGEIMGLLNGALFEDAPDGFFATLLLAHLDVETRSVIYASAGHVPGFVLSATGEVKAVLKSTGLPLAVLPGGEFPASASPALEPGDVLLLLTDGIIEARNAEDEEFGIERALNVVRRQQNEGAGEIIDSLLAEVRSYCKRESQLDDMTAVVIKAVPLPAWPAQEVAPVVPVAAALRSA